MKILLSIILSAGVGFAAAFFVVSNQKDAAFRLEKNHLQAQWQTERDHLETELAAERNKPAMVEQIQKEVAVNARRSAREILENLQTLKPNGGARIATIRKIVHELEDLADLKAGALGDIREFLTKNIDIDYSVERSDRSDGDRRWNPMQRSSAPTEFTLPPSLRIGLFDVLKEIGGNGAEEIMGEVLGTTGRAVEVAYLTRILEDLAPGKYREVALSAAKDLLRNPLPMDNPNRLDENAEGYLYSILELYNDASFVNEAKQLLVADGRLNRNARDYLSKVQGDQIVGTLYDVYSSNTLSNNWDKMSIGNRILDHVGGNAQANKFFQEVVSNPEVDTRMRSFAVMRLAGGFGDMESPKDPNQIRERMTVLAQARQTVNDERLAEAMDRTAQNLQNLLDGKPVENPWSRRGRDRGSSSGQPAAQ